MVLPENLEVLSYKISTKNGKPFAKVLISDDGDLLILEITLTKIKHIGD